MSSGRLAGALTVLAVPLWVAAACSSFEGGGAPAETDAATPDAAADTSSSDASSPTDASETSEAGDGASPCALPHTFCDDFDHDGGLTFKWTGGVFTSAGGALTLGPGLSAPSAMVATLVPFDAGASEVYLEKENFAPFSSVKCSWSVYVEKLPTVGLPDMVHVSIYPATPAFASAAVIISTSTNETRLSVFESGMADAADFAVYPTTAALATGTWHRVELQIDGAPTAKVTAKIGPYTSVATFPVAPYPNAKMRLRLGQGNVFANDGAKMRFDDVACDLTP